MWAKPSILVRERIHASRQLPGVRQKLTSARASASSLMVGGNRIGTHDLLHTTTSRTVRGQGSRLSGAIHAKHGLEMLATLLMRTGRREKLTCFLLALLFAAQVYASGRSSQVSESEDLIRIEFDRSKSGRAVSVRREGDTVKAEVCFDKCDYFEWSGSAEAPGIWDFILLIERKAGFASQIDSFKTAADQLVPRILKRFAKLCHITSDISSDFECDWAKLAKGHSLKVGVAVYDEGLRCFAWRDLASMEPPKKSKCLPITTSPWK